MDQGKRMQGWGGGAAKIGWGKVSLFLRKGYSISRRNGNGKGKGWQSWVLATTVATT